MQILRNETFEDMDPVFNDFWTLRDDDNHIMPISDVIILFKILDYEGPSKIVKAKRKTITNINPSFSFKGYSLPTTMDLYQWGNISFNSDYTNAMITTNSTISYTVNLDDSKAIVHIFSKGRLLFSFTDHLFNPSDIF